MAAPVRGQAGFITLDFMFACVLVAAMFIICFGVTLTLSMAEVAQYMTFSTARVYFAADLTQGSQLAAANAKWATLAAQPDIKAMFFQDTSLITLPKTADVADFNSLYPQSAAADSATFVGARAMLTAKILEFKVPIWGQVQAPDGNGFTATVGSYLGREPSTDECMSLWNAPEGRFTGIRRLKDASGATPYSGMTNANAYVVISDNGC